jgi:hypothetical protein
MPVSFVQADIIRIESQKKPRFLWDAGLFSFMALPGIARLAWSFPFRILFLPVTYFVCYF